MRTVICVARVSALLLLFVLPCSAARVFAQQSDYVVGSQDVLTISVWEGTDLSGKYTVEADGTITFPLLGRIKTGGLTLHEIEDVLKKRLSEGFFRNPQVSVAVEQYRSQRIFVVGEVRQPGTYPLMADMTLVEVLSRAGWTPALSAEAIIVRAAAGHAPGAAAVLPANLEGAEVLRVDLYKLQQGNLSQNVTLRDGDTIIVSRADTIYIYGHVKSPGAYALQARDMTVLQALALAGGLTERGSSTHIKISRVVNGKKQDIKVKLTDLVKPGDTIIVPQRFF